MKRLPVLLLRTLWWIACIPLEILHAVAVLLVSLLHRLTNRTFAFVWCLFWIWVDYNGSDFRYRNRWENAFYFWMMGLAVLCQFAPQLVFFVFRTPRPFWRLKPRKAVPTVKVAKEILATVVMQGHAEARQTRAAMTQRLAPALQQLIVR